MKKSRKHTTKVGDRVVYHDQPKTEGVTVEIYNHPENGKDIKVHWNKPPVGDGLHRNGRGSYNISQLKLMRI